nr:nucleoporin nup189-like [Procambarus clarkii]
MALMLMTACAALLDLCAAQGVAPSFGLTGAGTFPQDAGRFPQDTGRFPQDAGRFPQDAGRFPQDAGRFPQDAFGASGDGPRFFTSGISTNQNPGSLSNPGVGSVVNPFANDFGRGPTRTFGGNNFADGSFGVNGRLPSSFLGSTDSVIGSLGGFGGPVDSFDSSFGSPFGTGSLIPFLNGLVRDPVSSFGGNGGGSIDSLSGLNGRFPGLFLVSEDDFGGSFGDSRGSVGPFGSPLDGILGFNNNFDASFGVPSAFVGNHGGFFVPIVTPAGAFLVPSSLFTSS